MSQFLFIYFSDTGEDRIEGTFFLVQTHKERSSKHNQLPQCDI